MPKKKEKKSDDMKRDEVKKTSKKESSSTRAAKSVSDDREKDLYLTQIRYLNEQVERYQLKCDQHERQKKDLSSQYSSLEKEKKDVVDFLKRSVLEKEAEADELTEQLESQRRAADEEREALLLQLGQLRKEHQDRTEGLNAGNRTLTARLASLEEFQKQKEQLTSNMESLEKQLVSQEEQHKAAIHNLEMKALLDKKRLEKEMESHVATMAAEVQHLVDQKVPQTTRLALQENTEVKSRIGQLSEQTLSLMGENSALRDRKIRLSVDVDILEQMLSETSRKSCVRKKVAEQLTEKCRQLQTELKDRRQELEQLQAKHTGALAEMEALRQERASLSERCTNNRVQVSRLEAELQEERRRRSRMKSVMQEAAVALRQALMDVPTDQQQEEGGDSAVQWKQLMEKLLVVLDRPTLATSTAESDQLDELQTSGGVSPNLALSFQFELARYRPGDLGLIPRPMLKHKPIVCRTGAAGSSSTHVPLLRKPSSQKTAGCFSQKNSAVRLLTSRNSFAKPK
ncbi:cilia- and flagella-associated protein 157-like [Anarrhichthys ocellatus]|uniref:cilia- and flagella-associated protein 157-like n=1 Tax=Anarrhichthys ocellatus TaxID=433405 RepID=UPI0012ED281B|nr:cilia- and flagella-associated protein 157-like [Anarrhichthys ocellatus]